MKASMLLANALFLFFMPKKQLILELFSQLSSTFKTILLPIRRVAPLKNFSRPKYSTNRIINLIAIETKCTENGKVETHSIFF